MGPHEPYWRTNTSFSPPPPRWDFRFHSEVHSFHSQDGNHLYGSSTSSNSRESRNWLTTNHFPNHRHSNSDGIGPFFSSPSDLSPAQQSTPPTIQEIKLSFSPTSEGLNENRASISSNSDSSGSGSVRGCFMSKPVHPLSIPVSSGIHDSDDGCEFEFSDVSETIESDSIERLSGDKCGVCDRFLSQRSPWSSRQIIRSGDFPVTGVLSCRHVFHVECLDQTTSKTHKGDPCCPVCVKLETNKNSPENQFLSNLKNRVPRVKNGRCVEGVALSAPSCNAMLLINQNRIKKGVVVKGGSGKEFAGKLRCSPPWGGGGGVGSSKSASSFRKKL